MAIFHLDVKTISRSQGRSVVGAAAYRAGERILDERQGITFDYSQKKAVVYSEILAPAHAPEWVKDRARLWNEVEKLEKRKDSQLAREVLIALPQELTLSQNIELLKDYCQTQFIDRGMIADINIHHDKLENPHAHILLTMREISDQGFGFKNRDWNKRELVFEQRKAWQDIANVHLHLNGHQTRIDCRSLKDRGLELEPGLHLGPAAHQGEDFTRTVDRLEILRANGERIIEDPSSALKKLTQQQAVFTEFDMAKLANQYSADLEQYQAVLSTIKTHESVVTLGKDDYGNTVYSTQQMIALEHKMLNEAYDLDSKKDHGVDIQNSLLADKTLTKGQEKALFYLTAPGNLKVMTGLAGTGKSYVMGMVREAYETAGFKVSGACLSGIAAQSLEDGSGIPSQTIDSKLIQWGQGINPLTAQEILVIDEAGMVGTEKMEMLLSHANATNAKIILVHDPEQLSAIEFGAPSRAIAERFGQTTLTDIIRQRDPEMRQATLEFGTGQTQQALARYEALGALHTTAVDEKLAQKLMVEAWASDRLEGKTQLMLAYTNESVKALNEAARQIRVLAGELEPGAVFKVDRGDRAFSIGDRVYFFKNDRRLGVKNGSLGTIQAIENNQFKVLIDGKGLSCFDLSQYCYLDHGYAATVSKSQGVTVDKSYVLFSRYFDRHLSYVAGSRHRDSVQFYSHLEDFKNRDDLFKHLSRERSKSMAIDFAEARGVETNSPDVNHAPYSATQTQQALERQEIKTLNTHLPDKTFSFAQAYETVKGFIQGLVRLSNQKEMLCINQDHELKLVPLEHHLNQHLGKEARIHLDKETQVLNCEITEQHRGTEQRYEVVRDGHMLERSSIEKSSSQALDKQQTLQVEREQTKELSKGELEL